MYLECCVLHAQNPSDAVKDTTVWDLFAGTGALGVACRNLDCQYLGVESNASLVTVARSRIAPVCRTTFSVDIVCVLDSHKLCSYV